MTKIFAHRGASAMAPENTLDAFELAYRMGSDGIELDVHPTLDGAVVVIHDETIDKVSNGSGYVWEKELNELKSYDFSYDKEQYRGAKIPTLNEVYDFIKNTDLVVNVEIKDSFYIPYHAFNEKLIQIQEAHGLSDERIIYSSFNHIRLRELKKYRPMAQIGMLYSEVMMEPWNYIKQIPSDALHPHFSSVLLDGYVEECNKAGIKVRAWTVDNVDIMEKFIHQNIDVLMSNTPNIALELRNKIQL